MTGASGVYECESCPATIEVSAPHAPNDVYCRNCEEYMVPQQDEGW